MKIKKLLFIFLAFISIENVFAQTPQRINYQAVARDAGGNIIATAIGVKFEIFQGSLSGTLVYDEAHTITPSSVGIFTAGIGGGTPITGSFGSINWANGPYFLRVNIDPAGGSSYSTVGASQLVSVPYALYAETAGNATTYSAGNAIAITSGSIINTAPDQTVSITGPGVTGAYPNFTIAPGSALTPSTGISINSGTITNTAPDQTVTLNNGVNTTINGTYPNFTIDAVPSLSLSGNALSITGGNSVTLPTGTTYTNGTSISLVSGTIITNTAPDLVVGLNNGVNTNITGTYPNFTVDAVPTLSLAGNSLSISGGNSVTLPTPPALTAGAGISIASGSIITNTAPNQTVNITGTGVSTVSGTYPNYNVNVPSPTVSISGNTITVAQGSVVSTATISAGPWAASSGVLYPASNPTNDKVAIGQSVATSNLDVVNTAASSNSINPVASIVNNNTNFAASSVLSVRNNAGNGAIIYADSNSPSGDGISVNLNNTSNGSNALQVQQFGTGNSAYFSITNTANNSRVIDANTNGTGRIISAVNTNASNSSDAVYVQTNGTGAAGFFNKSGTGNGLYSLHSGTSGNAGFFNNSNASNASQALIVQTNGNGEALSTYNLGNGRALFATNTSSLPTILATNNGSGYALEANNTTAGNRAGYFNGGLDVRGKTSASGNFAFYVYNSSSTNLFNIRDDGNVGIGVPSPSNKLAIGNGSVEKINFNGTNGSINFLDDQGSIFFPNPAATPKSMIYMYNSGTSNSSRMVISHSTAFTNYGLEYDDSNDRFSFLSGGTPVLVADLGLSRVGIGIAAPTNKLHVNGGVTITDGTQGAGRILTSNAAGAATWKPNQIAFFAGANSTAGNTQALTTSQTATILFTSGASPFFYNNGGGFNASNGRFTAPVAGVYQINSTLVCAGAPVGYFVIRLKHSSGAVISEQDGFFNTIAQNWYSTSLTASVHLNSGEYVYIEISAGTAGGMSVYNDKSSFSGHLVYAD